MPNRFTPALDTAEVPSEERRLWGSSFHIPFFDAIFGEWPDNPTNNHANAWRLLQQIDIQDKTSAILFWAFLAELSDQDLEECFPEIIFPSPAKDQQ
jgi:hypothetical protein